MTSDWVELTLQRADGELEVGTKVYVNLAQAGMINPGENGGWQIWLSPDDDSTGWRGHVVVQENPADFLNRIATPRR